jgi:hypothetical protein
VGRFAERRAFIGSTKRGVLRGRLEMGLSSEDDRLAEGDGVLKARAILVPFVRAVTPFIPN